MNVKRKPRLHALAATAAALAIAAVGTAAAAGGQRGVKPLFVQYGRTASSIARIQNRSLHRSASSKLDARLAQLAAGGSASSTQGHFKPAGLTSTRNGAVLVVIEARQVAQTRSAVARLGGRVEASWRNLVQATVPVSALPELSRQQSVSFVRPPLKWVDESITGEEVAASKAPAWYAKNFTGKNVKVAIIDGGFEGLAQRQVEGELPQNVVTADYCGGHFADATEHGTGVAEIVHEMAPDAQLVLICFDSEVTLAAAEQFAKTQGVRIINHSVGWFNTGRGDGSGPIGSIVQDARNNGILWVNAAGNEAQTHYAGTFNDPNGNHFHEFVPGVKEGNFFVFPGGGRVLCAELRWDEWPVAQSDLDIGFGASGSIRFFSDGVQNGTQPPTEELCVQNNGATSTGFWVIYANRLVGNPKMDLFSISPPLQYETAAGSIADPATSPSALAVGALCWQNNAQELYSSQGPTIDGRVKPDLAGLDSVSGATYGPFAGTCPMTGFAGTSAASPEVAGAAALVKQAFPSFTPDQLQQFLMKSAKDLDPTGADNATGAGLLQLPTPPDQVPPVSKALASSGKRGGIVQLKSQASDDSGDVRVTEQVFRNGRLIATLQTKFASAQAPKTFVTAWKSPKKAKGVFKHCSQATDRAGNKEQKKSCAGVALN